MSPYVSMKNSPSNSTAGTASGSTEPSPLNSALNSPRGGCSSTDYQEQDLIFHNSKTELKTIGEDDRQYEVDLSHDIIEELNDSRSGSIKPFTRDRYVCIHYQFYFLILLFTSYLFICRFDFILYLCCLDCFGWIQIL